MSSQWDNPAEMLTRAQGARAQGDRDLAYQLYARASELSPQDAQAWRGRAETATSADEALVSYAYACALTPEDQPLTRTLDAALARRVQEANQTDAPLLVAMGQEFAEVGLTDRARVLLMRASELDSASTDAWVWLAGVSDDDQRRLDYLNRALAMNPRDARARDGLLTIKLPPPPSPQAPSVTVSNGEPTSAAAEPPGESKPLVAEPPGRETATMERLQKLRASVPPPAAPSPAPAPVVTPVPESDGRLRVLLFILLGIVLVLAVAGVLLLLAQ